MTHRCAGPDGLKQTATAGVDGLVWKEYEDGLEERLLDLHGRVHSGAYRALPSRRVAIPKPDGGTRPLGIAALEDKIVQKAVVDVILTPIYEPEFLGFSYGFRPGRGAHNALDALAFGIERRKVNWLVDADIRAFFDRLSRDHLLRFLESLLKCVWVAAAPVLCLHSRGTASRSTRRASGSHRRDARSPAACC